MSDTSVTPRDATVLHSEDRLFRLLVEDSREYAIFMLDTEGLVASWNAGAERIKGYAAAQIVGRHFRLFYTPADIEAKKPEHELTVALREGRFEEDGLRVRKDGSLFWAKVIITALRDDAGAPIGFAKFARDITEQRRRADLLQATNASLTRTLEEREVLLREIHHRVKNNLQVISSMINMQVRSMPDEASRSGLLECQNRVQAIALIHEKLYESADYSRIPFADYTRSLARSVFDASRVAGGAVSLELDVEDVALTVDKAIPTGLILNELVTNALKHAFPEGRRGVLRVALSRNANRQVMLSVSDDGVGFSAGFDILKSTSLGLQIVRTLAQQLKAVLVASGETGTSFRLTFDEGNT